jgi:signal transduction histidine kinase
VLRARLFRTSSFRLTALYAALFSTSVLVLFAVIYFATAHYMTQQLDRAIRAEIEVLQDEAHLGGVRRVATIIEKRQAETPRSGTVYLLRDAKGRQVAGNMSLRRPLVGWFELRGRSRAAEGEEAHRIRARGVKLADGGYLVVGQDAQQFDDMEGLIIRAFSWSLAASLILAILGGMLMSASVLRRIGSIARTSQAIIQGDLSQRLQDRGVGDEFDQLAGALNAMLARIETLLDGLKQVSNDVAHDLRTPLSRLRQRFEAVRRSTPSIADYETLVDRSIEDMDALLEMFTAMLRIAEIEATTRTSGFLDVDLSDVLQTVLEVYEPLATGKSQVLAGSIAPKLFVRGDRELLTQLFANLIENAIKHTPDGSRIAVEAIQSSGVVEAVVADTGSGIPEAERGKVFRRFYRLEPSRSVPGSGLGLSLVAAIAALHEIEIILADNRPGLRVQLRFSPNKRVVC